MKHKRIFAAIVIILRQLCCCEDLGPKAKPKGDFEVENRLLNDLLHNYDTKIPPPPDPVTLLGTNVTVYLWPYDIMTVDIQRNAIKISGWIDMRWTDRNLMWDPAKYDNISEVFIQRDQIWLPEIEIFYSKGNTPPERKICYHCPVRLTHDGSILRGYYIAHSFPCEVDVKRFPYDEHKCDMMVANWHMDDRYMDLWPHSTVIDLSLFLPNVEWTVVNMTVTRTRDHYNYGYFPILTYSLAIKRKPFSYVMNQVFPCIALTCTAIVGYHMPNTGAGMHGDKVKMGMTSILAILILELAVANKLPKVSDVVPLIVVFYGQMMVLLASGILATSAVIMVEKQSIYNRPIPEWVRRLFRLRHQKVAPESDVWVNRCARNRCRRKCVCRTTPPESRSAYEMATFPNQPCPTPGAHLLKSVFDQSRPGTGATKAMLDSVLRLRRIFEQTRRDLNAQKEKGKLKKDWLMLADKLEKCSLVLFLFSCMVCVWLFFHFDMWY